jgi:hypothetical protein
MQPPSAGSDFFSEVAVDKFTEFAALANGE